MYIIKEILNLLDNIQDIQFKDSENTMQPHDDSYKVYILENLPSPFDSRAIALIRPTATPGTATNEANISARTETYNTVYKQNAYNCKLCQDNVNQTAESDVLSGSKKFRRMFR